MGRIVVEGLGIVEIAGDKPTAAEMKQIESALASRPRSAATSAGQMGRAVVSTLGGVPAAIADLPGAAVNAAAGREVVAPWLASRTFQKGLDELGFPQAGDSVPESLAAVGAGAFALPQTAANLLGLLGPTTRAAAQNTGRNLLAELAKHPGTQVSGGVGGGAAQQAAAAIGAPTPVQIVAGIVGGGVTPLAGRGVAKLSAPLDPLTAEGRRTIVGDMLRQNADNPELAAVRLADTREIIPGSRPTIGGASRDAGLAAIETPILEQTPGGVAARTARLDANNAARQRYLDERGITQDRASAVMRQAGEAIDPMIAKAFEGAERPQVSGVLRTITDIKKSDGYVKGAVVSAIKSVEETLARAAGGRIGGPDLTAGRLWAAKQEIQALRLGKYSGEKGDARLAASQLKEIEKAIDDAIEVAAPGYKDARDVYARMARVGDSVKSAADIRTRGTGTQMDTAGQNDILALGKMKQALRSAVNDPDSGLMPVHRERIEKVLADMERAAMPNSPHVRSQGSPTARNLTMAHVLGKFISGRTADNSTARALSKTFEPIYGLANTDAQIQELLVKAMMDPKFAQVLLSEANQRNADAVMRTLTATAARGSLGGSAGVLGTPPTR